MSDDAADIDWYFRLARALEASGRFARAADVMARGLRKSRRAMSPLEHANFLRFHAYYRSLWALHMLPKPVRFQRRPGRPIGHAMHVSMVKDEGDIVHAHLANSYRVGLRYFVIADNGSSDSTRSEIIRFRDAHGDARVIVVDDPILAYYQKEKMTAFIEMGRAMLAAVGVRIDWVFPMDADEFIVGFDPARDLLGVLQRAEAEGRKMLLFFPSDGSSGQPLDDWSAGADPAATFSVISSFRGRMFSKLGYRYSSAAKLWMGNHFVFDCAEAVDDLQIAIEHGLTMLHYPMRSLAHARHKVVNGGRAMEAMETMGYCEHWRGNYAAIRENAAKERLPIRFETLERNSENSPAGTRSVTSRFAGTARSSNPIAMPQTIFTPSPNPSSRLTVHGNSANSAIGQVSNPRARAAMAMFSRNMP